MRKILIVFLSLFLSSAFADTPKKIFSIQHWVTKSGAKVFFVTVDSLPMVDIRVIFAAGSAYDGKKPGIASLTNNMIGEGTKTQTAREIAETFDNVGAQFATSMDRDKAVVSLRSLTNPKYFEPALKEFDQALSGLSIVPKAWQRVRNQTIAAIKVKQQRPDSVAMTAFYETVYGNQPYGHNPLGTLSSVKLISSKEAFDFYKKHYVAKNANIVLVGNLSLEQAKTISNQIADALPEGHPSAQLALSKAAYKDVHRHIQFTAKQTAILLGQVGITHKSPDYFPLIVGNYIFGGMPLGSILFQQVRNKNGLAYYAGSSFQTLRYRGPFIIQLNTRDNKTKDALSIVKNVLAEFIENGPTKEQLNAAKLNLIGRFPLAISSNSNIADIVSNIAFYQLPLDYLDTYRSKIQAVTLEQVKNAFIKYIHPDRMIVVTVGPTYFRK